MSDYENQTLWEYCFFLEAQFCKDHGRDVIQFADVDARVVEMSRKITEYGEWPRTEGK